MHRVLRASFNPPPAMRPGETAVDSRLIAGPSRFQSAPGDEAGGNVRSRTRAGRPSVFQSAPGDEAGGNADRRDVGPLSAQFQSAPGDEAGGNARRDRVPAIAILFQSAPGDEAGGNADRSGRIAVAIDGFNPPPAVRPGETSLASRTWTPDHVSIRPRR